MKVRDGNREFGVDELKAAFDRVADPADWRGPISAWVAGENVPVVTAAIKFYTATEPKVSCDGRTNRIERFLIESEGYRAGPAGDH